MTDAIAIKPPSALRRIFDNRIVRFVVLFAVVVAVQVASQIAPEKILPLIADENRAMVAIALAAAFAAGMLLVYAVVTRLMEHRAVRELSLSRAPGGLVAGAAIGFGLFALVMATLYGIGVATFHATPGNSLFGAANMAVFAAIGEELLVRGVIYRIFEEMFGSFVAILVSAALFGAAHLGNPGATIMSGVAIALEAGLLLAVCYTWARHLWLPIGVHFGWNFTEGAIFGAAVSGKDFKGLYETKLAGTELLTGGAFGAEGSIVAIAVCMSAALVIFIAALRRGEWKGFRFAINDRG